MTITKQANVSPFKLMGTAVLAATSGVAAGARNLGATTQPSHDAWMQPGALQRSLLGAPALGPQAALSPVPAPAPHAAQPGTISLLRNPDLCMAVLPSSDTQVVAPKDTVNVSTCDASLTQRWSRGKVDALVVNDLCLGTAINMASAGAFLDVTGCSGGVRQAWITLNETIKPAANTSLCVDVAPGNVDNSGSLLLQPCTGAATQAWNLSI